MLLVPENHWFEAGGGEWVRGSEKTSGRRRNLLIKRVCVRNK